MSDIVDVHAHFAPPQYVAELAPLNLIQPQIGQWSIEKHLDEMNAAGIGRSLLSITTPGITIGDVTNARRIARYSNEYAADLTVRYPGRLGMFAALPLTDIDGSLAELAYALDVLHAQGIGLFTSYADVWLGDPAFAPIYEELQRRKAIVYVHPTVPACCNGVLPFISPALIEYGSDTTRAITTLIYRGAAARYPSIRWIFSHAGGTMPYLIERFDADDAREPKRKLAAPDGYRAAARRFFYDTAQSSNVATLSALQHVIPTSQVLFGTDYPFRTMREHVTNLAATGVYSTAEIAGIHRGNVATALPELLA
jgi:6-methylsalicylate decarboxylase